MEEEIVLEDLKKISDFILEKDYFGILTHMSPDGDALGSAFSLCRALQSIKKHAKILCNDPIPEKFSYMKEFIKPEDFNPQCLISVDVADKKLLGDKLKSFEDKVDVRIDHHKFGENFAKLNFVDSKSAANCEIMYELILKLGIKIDKEIATCLYTGIATDTGCFKFSNTTAKTHLITSKLMDLGISADKLNEKLFIKKSKKRLETEKLMNNNLEYFFGGRCAVTSITLEEMEILKISENELDGIASIPIETEGVDIGVVIKEKTSNFYKISVRTTDKVDAAEFCKIFGGGGHSRAAGFSSTLALEELKKEILNKLGKYLNF